jgi:hypothetical protein
VSNLAMWGVIRADEPSDTIHPLIDFIRLPRVIQEAIGLSTHWGSPRICVAANCDRISQHYPDEPREIDTLLRVWRSESIGLVTTYTNVERKSRFSYDYSFKVSFRTGGDWRECEISCEKAPQEDTKLVGVTVPAFSPLGE